MKTWTELLALDPSPLARLWDGHKDGARSLKRLRRCLSHLPPDPGLCDGPALEGLALALEGEGLGPGSVNRHLAAVSRALKWARQWGLVSNPALIPSRKEPRGRDTVLTDDQMERVEGWFRGKGVVYGVFLRFLWETGLRVSEAHTLRFQDFHTDPNGITWVTPVDTKNGSSRSVPLSEPALRAVREVESLSNRGGVEDQAAGPNPFARISRSTLSHLWVKCRSELGLPRGAVLHSLRHSRASRLVNAGVPLAHIGQWLGHRSLQTTLRYAHTDRSSLLKALEATR